MSISMFDTRTMLGIVNEFEKKPKTFLRDRYFSHVVTYDTAKIDVDVVGADGRHMAPFVHPKIGGKAVTREGFKVRTYEAPEVSPFMTTDAEDLLKRTPGENIYSSKSPAQRAVEQLGRDLSKLDDRITRREEWMCAQALFTGKIDIVGEGVNDVLNYWPETVSEQPASTVGTLWTSADATAKGIMADLRAVKDMIHKLGGVTPRELIVGRKVRDAFLNIMTDAKLLDMRKVELGHISPRELPQGVTYYGSILDPSLDIYTYDEWYVNEATGEEQPMVPENKILVASPNVETTRAYGCVALRSGEEVAFYEGQRIPHSWLMQAPQAGRSVQLKSRPLPIIHQIYGFHVLTAAE